MRPQPCVVEAAACNRVWWRLQPYVMEAAAACNHCMCWRLRQPYVMEAAARMYPLQRPAGLMPPATRDCAACVTGGGNPAPCLRCSWSHWRRRCSALQRDVCRALGTATRLALPCESRKVGGGHLLCRVFGGHDVGEGGIELHLLQAGVLLERRLPQRRELALGFLLQDAASRHAPFRLRLTLLARLLGQRRGSPSPAFRSLADVCAEPCAPS